MPYPRFDRSRLRIQPLADRVHDIDLSVMIRPGGPLPAFDHPALPAIADRIRSAKQAGAAVVVLLGAHVLRRGNGPLLIDLMEQGYINHLGLNGAGAIHEFEFSLIGKTCESVARYVRTGEFGLWEETGRINGIAVRAAREGIGLGEALGREIHEGNYPHRQYSVLAAGYRLGIPVTVHVSIGQDIVHEHPNCDGGAYGSASYTDFLVFTQSITNLEHGVFLNIGTAVMGPEVYLKALTMARNVARQEDREIRRFTTAVFDLPDLGEDLVSEAPKNDPRYYFRPFKTILVRTVADGGESFYVQGDHARTVPHLHARIVHGGPTRG